MCFLDSRLHYTLIAGFVSHISCLDICVFQLLTIKQQNRYLCLRFLRWTFHVEQPQVRPPASGQLQIIIRTAVAGPVSVQSVLNPIQFSARHWRIQSSARRRQHSSVSNCPWNPENEDYTQPVSEAYERRFPNSISPGPRLIVRVI